MKKGNTPDLTKSKLQNYKVVKSNDFIQKSRFQLSLQEQKIILYLISKIKPEDIELKLYTFEITEFCKVCGFESSGGSAYNYIKDTIKNLADKSIWVKLDSGRETLVRWIERPYVDEGSGKIDIKLDELMKPYLLQLKNRYTSYELLYILAMKSQYSIRLYELLKSYEYQHKKIFDIDELKNMLFAEKYKLFGHFREKVLDISMREINDLSDLTVTYEPIKESRRYARIEFSIKIKKGVDERLRTFAKIDNVLNPDQMSIFDIYREVKQ